MLEAAQFYHQLLVEDPTPYSKVIDYLSKRGAAQDTISKFLIGYCPPFSDEKYKGRAFLTHITPELDKDYTRFKDYSQTSLLRLLDDDNSYAYIYYRQQIDFSMRLWGRYADYFAARITFPVFDVDGQIQGIIGRRPDNRRFSWMKQAGGDTNIRTKGWLYGIDKAAKGIAEYQTVIVVEGIFDYFAFYNISENQDSPMVVSSLGARLDSQAIDLLEAMGARYFIIAFDSDEAGRKGILDSVGKIRDGRVSYLGSLKDGEDPAQRLKAIVGSLSNFGIRHLQKGMEVKSPSGKPVMASLLVQRQQGSKAVTEEILIKPVEAMRPTEFINKEKPTVSLWYRVEEIIPLLTYDHGNRAELDQKLEQIRSMLDSPIRQEPETKDGWFTLPVKYIENEIYFKLNAALILHLRLAIEQPASSAQSSRLLMGSWRRWLSYFQEDRAEVQSRASGGRGY